MNYNIIYTDKSKHVYEQQFLTICISLFSPEWKSIVFNKKNSTKLCYI